MALDGGLWGTVVGAGGTYGEEQGSTGRGAGRRARSRTLDGTKVAKFALWHTGSTTTSCAQRAAAKRNPPPSRTLRALGQTRAPILTRLETAKARAATLLSSTTCLALAQSAVWGLCALSSVASAVCQHERVSRTRYKTDQVRTAADPSRTTSRRAAGRVRGVWRSLRARGRENARCTRPHVAAISGGEWLPRRVLSSTGQTSGASQPPAGVGVPQSQPAGTALRTGRILTFFVPSGARRRAQFRAGCAAHHSARRDE